MVAGGQACRVVRDQQVKHVSETEVEGRQRGTDKDDAVHPYWAGGPFRIELDLQPEVVSRRDRVRDRPVDGLALPADGIAAGVRASLCPSHPERGHPGVPRGLRLPRLFRPPLPGAHKALPQESLGCRRQRRLEVD